MIIVGQDKMDIVNIDNVTRIFIESLEDGTFGIGADTNSAESHVWDLGYYKTKERAKEVLQEIIEEYEDCNSSYEHEGYIKNKTYYMPKE